MDPFPTASKRCRDPAVIVSNDAELQWPATRSCRLRSRLTSQIPSIDHQRQSPPSSSSPTSPAVPRPQPPAPDPVWEQRNFSSTHMAEISWNWARHRRWGERPAASGLTAEARRQHHRLTVQDVQSEDSRLMSSLERS
ncbi:uncharacterized protein LOC124708338 [Lolium rigidum]|uniref:uncharacterized protein LOC124708338 n=1 Tax=Lolium rigidum TaxID=89674 RepID=UPI001F5C14D3|nr:uncharacterized protein LOC124708338 [Lolium rigidum]